MKCSAAVLRAANELTWLPGLCTGCLSAVKQIRKLLGDDRRSGKGTSVCREPLVV